MLTVKHVDADGSEYLMEANKVDVVKGEHAASGIFLDRTPAGSGHVIEFARVGEHEMLRGTPGEWKTHPRVYVMNRFGATVAQYNL